MVKGIGEGLYFFFALSDLSVELVSVPLELLLFLGCLDHIVGLGVLPHGLYFPTAGLTLLHKTFVFDSQVLDFIFPELKLHSDLVPLLLRCLLLRNQDIFVHLNLLFSLLHAHLQLVLPILKTIHSICLHIHSVSQLLYLKLHDVMLYHSFFFFLLNFIHIAARHLILKF